MADRSPHSVDRDSDMGNTYYGFRSPFKLKDPITLKHHYQEVKMTDQWTRVIPDGRRVKYTFEEFSGDSASMTARVEGEPGGTHLLTEARIKLPLTREDVERRFEAQIQNK